MKKIILLLTSATLIFSCQPPQEHEDKTILPVDVDSLRNELIEGLRVDSLIIGNIITQWSDTLLPPDPVLCLAKCKAAEQIALRLCPYSDGVKPSWRCILRAMQEYRKCAVGCR